MSEVRIGSLCTGYGGLDAAVMEVFGGSLAWVADPDPGKAAILAHHHPDIPNLGDITEADFREVEPVDIVCAGFPCQDISNAGRRAGLQEGNRSGLWYHVYDAIEALGPSIVVLENVAAIRTRGLDVVLQGLADLGFDAEWTRVGASDAGAPHQRWRWFLLAVAGNAADPLRERPRQPGVAQEPGTPGDADSAAQDAHRPAGGERGVPAPRQA